jgi:hypothetical protein
MLYPPMQFGSLIHFTFAKYQGTKVCIGNNIIAVSAKDNASMADKTTIASSYKLATQ